MSIVQEKDGSKTPVQGSSDLDSKDQVEELENHNEKTDLESADKDDDSDQQVDWSTKQIIATVSLALIYVG